MPFLASALTFDAMLAAIPFILLFLAGLGWLLRGVAGDPSSDLARLFESFLPPHQLGAEDPFATAERLLARVARYGQQVSILAVPAFLWFATRAFASVRTALNDVFDVSLRPAARRSFLVGLLVAKLRDLTMVVVTLGLFLLSTAATTGIILLQARGEQAFPGSSFFTALPGRVLGELIAFGSILVLFLLLYRYASTRRIRIRSALVASLFAAVAFEVARRLFAFYLTNVASWSRPSTDAGIAAVILFVLWLYYSAFVFLLGAVVAETWELRHLLRRHRAVLA